MLRMYVATVIDIIGVSEPHTSRKNGTSVIFMKIYRLMIQASCIHNSLFLKNYVDNLQCFLMCVHYANNYQSSLLTLHVKLVRMFMTQNYQSIVYWCFI